MNGLKFIIILSSLLFMMEEVYSKLVLVDLTYEFDNDTTLYWPTLQKWRFQIVDAGSNAVYKSFRFCAAEHGGTHMDAPLHFSPGGPGASEVPMEKLIGDGFLVDVSNEVANNRDLQITINHLTKAEKEQKSKVDDKIVLFYTGFSSKYPNATDYFGFNSTHPYSFHFPGLSPEAAQWLIENRNVKALGIDVASIDFGQSKDFGSHKILSKIKMPFFENVNLKEVEKIKNKKHLTIHALPMKIKGGSGAPLRIVASYINGTSNSAPSMRANQNNLFTIILVSTLFLSQAVIHV